MANLALSATILLVCFFLVSCAEEPGLKFRVSHEGLNYAAQEAVNVAAQLLLDQEIPEFSGEADLTLGSIKYALNSLRIVGFDRGRANVHLTDEQAVLDVSGIGMTLKGNWAYNYKLGIIPISDSGKFDLKVADAALKLGVIVGMADDGKLTLTTTECQGGVDKLEVTFQGGASWLYNIFSSIIAKQIRNTLNGLLCDGIESAIEDYLAPILDELALEFPIADIGSLDFHFVAPPAFTGECIETYHKGEFFLTGDRTEAPFSPAPMPDPDEELRMLTVWMSDYVINTLFYVVHTKGLINFDIDDSILPDEMKGALNMTCPGSTCFGSVLPKELAEQFPEATVSISAWTETQPTLQVTSKGLRAKLEARMDFTAIRPNGETFMLFSTLSKFDVSMNGRVEDNKLKFSVKSIVPKVTLLESNVDGITGSLLTLVFRIGVNGALKPFINSLGEQGIPIPDFEMIEYINPIINFSDNTIVMMLDVGYAPGFFTRSVIHKGRQLGLLRHKLPKM